mmetsp:Transcript_41589/g.107636  ORF Transcript_41589/g.107636 Transcript_41589/m.107636 type:complete len:148 (+) Transcript_41589:405-848(+)
MAEQPFALLYLANAIREHMLARVIIFFASRHHPTSCMQTNSLSPGYKQLCEREAKKEERTQLLRLTGAHHRAGFQARVELFSLLCWCVGSRMRNKRGGVAGHGVICDGKRSRKEASVRTIFFLFFFLLVMGTICHKEVNFALYSGAL